MSAVNDNERWPENWQPITDMVQQKGFEAELIREAPEGHLLFKKKFSALARRDFRDDFLFQLEDGSFAQVHLTWRIETDPFWPFTTLHATFHDWTYDVLHNADGYVEDED